MNKLSARQINYFDEIQTMRESNKRTLRVAINYSINMDIDIEKKYKELWEELKGQFDLELNVEYELKTIDGCFCAVEKEK